MGRIILALLFACTAYVRPASGQVEPPYSLETCKLYYKLDSLARLQLKDSCYAIYQRLIASNPYLKEERQLYMQMFDISLTAKDTGTARQYLYEALARGVYCRTGCDSYKSFLVFQPEVNRKYYRLFTANAARYQRSYDSLLADSIRRLFVTDQHIRSLTNREDSLRRLGLSLPALIRQTDSVSTAFAKRIVHLFGWPGYSMLGHSGDNEFWTIVQHSDDDVSFQMYALQQLLSALLINNTRKSNFAFLYDRICVNRKSRQLFGTQCSNVKDSATGSIKLVTEPLQDPANVDYYRFALGLGPLKSYIQEFEQNLNRRN